MSSAAVRRGAASWWRSVAVHLHTCAPRTSAPSRARVVVRNAGDSSEEKLIQSTRVYSVYELRGATISFWHDRLRSELEEHVFQAKRKNST